MSTDHDNPELESCRIKAGGVPGADDLSWKSFDRLDKLAVMAVIVMVVVGAGIIVNYSGQDNSVASVSRQAVVIISPEFDNKLLLARTLLNNGNLPKSRELINSMIIDYPYDGRPYMLLGDLFIHEQQPVLAMLEYRKGIDLNPDFLDKKAKKLFRGKHIKNVLDEARQVISEGLNKNPGDLQLKEQLETLYYMLRRVAGSCG